ncbi:MAG: hypothetical protein BSOLF_2051 [Candidatus Carbobacillus altaicus]|uniref:Uncharacterized protein n=1 Tax=Candidatus Carbonibacillus altaicus TaxID=2163959 RepID=A0A2R6Y3D3_9BACL|nr:MAG: hypothetical protein BSOLF_2051 [Candidatus Carbobacillus altaicus]
MADKTAFFFIKRDSHEQGEEKKRFLYGVLSCRRGGAVP